MAWRFGATPATLVWCGVVAVLVALAAIDWDTTVLPDALTLPLLWAGLVAAALGVTIPLPQALWGAVAGYLSLWSVYWLFKLTTGKEGMGYGDFKLLAALGAWLGWQMIVPILLLASVIGAVVGIAMKLGSTLREGRYVPFGPFLAGAGIAVMLVGAPAVLRWLGWSCDRVVRIGLTGGIGSGKSTVAHAGRAGRAAGRHRRDRPRPHRARRRRAAGAGRTSSGRTSSAPTARSTAPACARWCSRTRRRRRKLEAVLHPMIGAESRAAGSGGRRAPGGRVRCSAARRERPLARAGSIGCS